MLGQYWVIKMKEEDVITINWNSFINDILLMLQHIKSLILELINKKYEIQSILDRFIPPEIRMLLNWQAQLQ